MGGYQFVFPPTRVSGLQVTQKYRCKLCDKSYASLAALRRHHDNLHGCDAGARLANEAERHLLRFRCKFCEKTYKNKRSVWEHKRSVMFISSLGYDDLSAGVSTQRQHRGNKCEYRDCGLSWNIAKKMGYIDFRTFRFKVKEGIRDAWIENSGASHLAHLPLAFPDSIILSVQEVYSTCPLPGDSFIAAFATNPHKISRAESERNLTTTTSSTTSSSSTTTSTTTSPSSTNKKAIKRPKDDSPGSSSNYSVYQGFLQMQPIYLECQLSPPNARLVQPVDDEMDNRSQFRPRNSQNYYQQSQRPFECRLCNKKYSYKSDLKVHYNNIHGDSSIPMLCGFEQQYVVNCIPRSNKQFKCLQCGKTYTGKSPLEVHFRNIHGALAMPVTCSKCGRKYKNSNRQQRQRKARTFENAADSKQYNCLLCEKTYIRKGHLVTHMNNIHGELSTPRQCSKCLRVYKNASSLHMHMKYTLVCITLSLGWYWFTGDLMLEPWRQQNLVEHSSTHKKVHHCLFCEKVYYKSWHLKTHIQNIHGDLSAPRVSRIQIAREAQNLLTGPRPDHFVALYVVYRMAAENI
ncbi:hypothetical protein B566_EDAN016982 [Ephemera danica]|nr:hypothetical protein B566_EDAN016982 [Ephemera danica]